MTWGSIWGGWLKIARIIGTVQMVIILTVVYWLVITLTAVPFGTIADPLRFRRRSRSAGWLSRHEVANTLDSLRRQG